MSDYVSAAFTFIIPLITVFLVQPSVAKVALAKNFVAEPEDRFPGLPLLSLGGVSMFIGINLSVSLFCTKTGFVNLHHILAAMIVMLFSGFLMDTNMAYRYFRFFVKLLAAILVVIRMQEGPFILFENLSSLINVILQLAFLVIFMFVFHRLTIRRKTLFLALAMINAFAFGLLYINMTGMRYWALLAFSFSGSMFGILSYSRYALFKKKPLPLIGHTGIYLSALILSTLWLTYISSLVH